MNERLILIVDDEPDICGEISGYLSTKGYQVIVAHNGKDAVKLFMQHRPVLVLSDYKMPIMNGVELLRSIKSINKDIHVVLMSGAADGKTIVNAMKEDAFDFLSKPIDLSNLLSVIGSAISKTQSKLAQDSVRKVSMTFISEVAEIDDDIMVLYFSSDLDEYTSAKYDTYIKKLVNERTAKKNLIFYLKSVKYINNIGLNLLISLSDFMKDKGYVLYLCSLSQQVDFYLRSLGYLNYFNVDNSVESIVERIHMINN
jgi:anti-anti-sigma factor